MTTSSLPPLSDEEQRQFCSLLMVGCDRETASKYLGFTRTRLQDELKRDPEFLRQALRAEGTAELRQIQNLREATKDSKQWRASVWWLERMAPERFGKRTLDTITASQWSSFLEALAEAIVSEVTHEADQQRLLARVSQWAQSVHTEIAAQQCTSSENPAIEQHPDESRLIDEAGD